VPEFRTLTWNLFHGRDFPPNDRLFTLRSRLLRATERDATHAQVNRDLLAEFSEVLAGATWELCLLQEVPPHWAGPLAQRCHAEAARVLTSRNQLPALRRRLAGWNPDLVGSAEGGSNLTLVRSPWHVTEQRELLLNPLPDRRFRERRRMSFIAASRDGGEVCIGNLHATAGDRKRAEQDVLRAAEAAVGWSGGRPLLLGGDYNVRPASSKVFEELERRFGLAGPTGPHAIDHLLVRGMETVQVPRPWPPERRELEIPSDRGTRRLRLSDHAPIQATYRLPAPGVR
jgi:endonuclease/exonuclease/phosphatase family metal-dependent hydrolase